MFLREKYRRNDDEREWECASGYIEIPNQAENKKNENALNRNAQRIFTLSNPKQAATRILLFGLIVQKAHDESERNRGGASFANGLAKGMAGEARQPKGPTARNETYHHLHENGPVRELLL